MQDEEIPNVVYIKDEFPFNEITSPLKGIVYVQQDEKYYIKCSLCELNFEIIEKFTKHCVQNHHDSFLDLQPVENTSGSGNSQEILEFAEENLNSTNAKEFSNEDPFTTTSGTIKKEQNECWRNQEKFITNSEIGSKLKVKCEDQNVVQETFPSIENSKTSNELKCEICKKQLMSRSGYLRHIKRQKCAISEEFEITSFNCEICNKEFTTLKLLKCHELRHQKTDILTCTHCNTEFRHKKTFLDHLKIHSETAKAHKCEICLKIFRTNYNLKCHRIIVHSSEPFYKCNQCSKSFHSRYKFREHKSDFHNGPPKHKCKYCSKSFRSFSYLEVHERVHTGEKPYQCEICGQSFAAVKLLTSHNKRHTNERNYKCDICGKSFFTATYLRDHMVTHTKIKSISCEVCDARFTLRSALIKHRKLHSGIKEYVCKLCGKAYAQGPGLYAHMKTHKLAQESTDQ